MFSSCLARGMNRLGLVLVVASGTRRNFPRRICTRLKRKKTARLFATFSVLLFIRVCVAVEPVYLTFDASYLVGGWARTRPADFVWILLKGHDTPSQVCVVGWRRSSLGCFKSACELFSALVLQRVSICFRRAILDSRLGSESSWHFTFPAPTLP